MKSKLILLIALLLAAPVVHAGDPPPGSIPPWASASVFFRGLGYSGTDAASFRMGLGLNSAALSATSAFATAAQGALAATALQPSSTLSATKLTTGVLTIGDLTYVGQFAPAQIPGLSGTSLTSGTVSIVCTTGTGGAFGSSAFQTLVPGDNIAVNNGSGLLIDGVTGNPLNAAKASYGNASSDDLVVNSGGYAMDDQTSVMMKTVLSNTTNALTPVTGGTNSGVVTLSGSGVSVGFAITSGTFTHHLTVNVSGTTTSLVLDGVAMAPGNQNVGTASKVTFGNLIVSGSLASDGASIYSSGNGHLHFNGDSGNGGIYFDGSGMYISCGGEIYWGASNQSHGGNTFYSYGNFGVDGDVHAYYFYGDGSNIDLSSNSSTASSMQVGYASTANEATEDSNGYQINTNYLAASPGVANDYILPGVDEAGNAANADSADFAGTISNPGANIFVGSVGFAGAGNIYYTSGYLQIGEVSAVSFGGADIQSIGNIYGNLRGSMDFQNGASVITAEGDTFYAHTVGGNLVWSNP